MGISAAPDSAALHPGYSEPLGSNFSFKHAGGASSHNHQLVAARIFCFNVTLSTEPAYKHRYSVCWPETVPCMLYPE